MALIRNDVMPFMTWIRKVTIRNSIGFIYPNCTSNSKISVYNSIRLNCLIVPENPKVAKVIPIY